MTDISEAADTLREALDGHLGNDIHGVPTPLTVAFDALVDAAERTDKILDNFQDEVVQSIMVREQLAAATERADMAKIAYGKKHTAITEALGWATTASDSFVNGYEEQGIAALDKVVSILVDA